MLTPPFFFIVQFACVQVKTIIFLEWIYEKLEWPDIDLYNI